MENKSKLWKQGRVLTERVFKWWDYGVFSALTCVCWTAFFQIVRRGVQLETWIYHPVLFSFFAFALLIVFVNNQAKWFLLPLMRKPRQMSPKPGLAVGVATSYVPGAEPIEMLETSLRALVNMDYLHDTWVLDEGDTKEAKELCKRLGARHFSRKLFPCYQASSGKFQSRSKHGNYNAWLHEIGFKSYEIITIFDPDHVPEQNFLSSVLGYFDDPEVGYVQAAQAYYNQKASFIARGAAEETYAYYSSVQMAGYGLGYPIIVGCHNTHRVSALKELGGLPPHDAEDLLATMRYRTAQWCGVYVPEILARGLAPVDWSGYLIQQRRWARSVLDLKLRVFSSLSGKLPWKTRIISLLHGLNYLHKSFLLFAGLIAIGAMLATGVRPTSLSSELGLEPAILFAALLLCGCYGQRFYLGGHNEWGLHWRAWLLQLVKWPYFLLALWDVLSKKSIPYVLTRKAGRVKGGCALFWPHIVIIGFIDACWAIGNASGLVLSPFLQSCAAMMAGISLGAILTEHLHFPDPYEGKFIKSSK